jgi:hypothetical protein
MAYSEELNLSQNYEQQKTASPGFSESDKHHRVTKITSSLDATLTYQIRSSNFAKMTTSGMRLHVKICVFEHRRVYDHSSMRTRPSNKCAYHAYVLLKREGDTRTFPSTADGRILYWFTIITGNKVPQLLQAAR